MQLGEELNGYRIVSEPTSAGAGMSQWAIAERDGVQYFIKMYLAPKYPLPSSPGSEAGKRKRLEECERFERRQLEIVKRLRPDAPGGGHLVTTLEFFRVTSSYYKVTRLVQTDSGIELDKSPAGEQQIALRSLFFSIKLLHDQGVVHGDLKPENVLFERTKAGAVTAKLIDFDEAYPTGEPPEAERIVGDPRYYSPELFRYVKGDAAVTPAQLTLASDIFALGLLVFVLVSGRLPGLPEGTTYPCETVFSGKPMLLTRAAVPENLQEVLPLMLSGRAEARPTIDQIIAASRGETIVPARPPVASPPESWDTSKRVKPVLNSQGSPKLRSTFGGPKSPPAGPPAGGAPPNGEKPTHPRRLPTPPEGTS